MPEHNPYEPPKAQVVDYLPKLRPDDYAEIGRYGGFWRRFCATMLDSLIISPLILLVYFGSENSRKFYFYYAVPGLLFTLFYRVFLVAKFGGTPGKRILKMRIARMDGTPVTFKRAFVRYSVVFTFAVISAVALAIAASNMLDTEYYSLNYAQKIAALNEKGATWSRAVTFLTQFWLFLGGIVMLCNTQRRAIHDFMAGTVVLRTDP